RLGQAEKARRMLARYQRYRDFDAQRQALQTRATERPDDAEAQFRLGALALRARQYEAAAEQFERAIILAPGHAAAHAGLAAAYGALGRPEDQAAELQTGASLRRAANRGTV